MLCVNLSDAAQFREGRCEWRWLAPARRSAVPAGRWRGALRRWPPSRGRLQPRRRSPAIMRRRASASASSGQRFSSASTADRRREKNRRAGALDRGEAAAPVVHRGAERLKLSRWRSACVRAGRRAAFGAQAVEPGLQRLAVAEQRGVDDLVGLRLGRVADDRLDVGERDGLGIRRHRGRAFRARRGLARRSPPRFSDKQLERRRLDGQAGLGGGGMDERARSAPSTW